MSARAEMIAVSAGARALGSDLHYPEERPARRVEVPAFRLDRRPVSVADFAAFVADTGWVTAAEARDPPGSAVFQMTPGPVDLRNPAHWWRFVPGANWRRPEGPDSTSLGREDHPVTHIARADAEAFARWRGVRLPTEAEWETAARLDAPAAEYAWGHQFAPEGALRANVWTGAFPWYFAREAGPGTTAIGAFPQTLHGFVDLIGNVWEWTSSPFKNDPCSCAPEQGLADALIALKGGSFLCAGEYCHRYRPAARIGVSATTTTAHIGFRCAADA